MKTEFGTPGRISKDNMFKSKYKGVGFGLKSIINTLTGEVDLDKIYEQNLATAMQNKNIQPKKIKEKYGDRGFTEYGEDPARDADESTDVTEINNPNKAAAILANPNNFSASEVDAAKKVAEQTFNDKKPAVGEGSLDAAMRAARLKAFSSMGQSDRFKTVTDAGGRLRSAESQGGRGVTTNLRSFEKGGLLNKKPKKKKVMKRGGLASKK